VASQIFGQCLCGSVQYAVDSAFEYALHCHCSNCRRATGAAFKSLAGLPRSGLKLVRGADNLLIFGDKDAAHDSHCAKCGSLLFSTVRGGAYAHVAMGTLVDEPGIKPSMHICVGSKAEWYEITDDLPQFAALPD
jgi:hypothetical protein